MYILNNLKDKYNNPNILLTDDFNEKLLKKNLNYEEKKIFKLMENNKLIRINGDEVTRK
jgi:hypothetical protein